MHLSRYLVHLSWELGIERLCQFLRYPLALLSRQLDSSPKEQLTSNNGRILFSSRPSVPSVLIPHTLPEAVKNRCTLSGHAASSCGVASMKTASLPGT